MKKSQTVKTTKNTFTSNINRGISTGLGPSNRTIIATRTQIVSGTGGAQPGLRRSSRRGSRVWKKTVLGEKFEYSEKLKEKKNYILYVSGMGHLRKQIEEIEEMPKPEPPKEKVVEVREIIDNYEYHETKNVKKKDKRRTSITHHERLSTPFERTTLKKFSSNTSVPQSRGYTTTTVERRIITDTGAKNTINLNKYNSFTTKQQTNKPMVLRKLYETYKPAKTQYTKTTQTITTENKAPNTSYQPRNKTITQTKITKTKSEISKISDRRQTDNNRPKYQPQINNKYNRTFNDGNNETKTETTQDGEYVVKVTTIKTQIGKYGKPQEIQRGGSAPRPGQRPRNEVPQKIRNSGPKPDFERPPRHNEFSGPHLGPHGPYVPRGFSIPHGFEGPHMPPPRMPRFEMPKPEEKGERPKSFERPHGPMPHVPIRPHGFLGPHGPMLHGPHYGPHGFLGPHHPDFEGKHIESGYMRHHGSRGTIEQNKTYQVKTEIRRNVDNEPKPEEKTLPVRRENLEIRPRAFIPSHGPHHGLIPPHGPLGPHHEPHGLKTEEKTLTEENRKGNVIGVSQYRFQQTSNKSDNGDNYEYFESKHVVKSGRVNQPITVHHRRGGKEDTDNKLSNSVNRSSSYNKTSTQIQTRNVKTGSNIEGTKYTQKTTNIRVEEGNNEGKGIYTEYKKYTQKGTGTSSINASKYGANTVNAGSRVANKSQYRVNTTNSGASSINKSKDSAGNINASKYTNITVKNEISSNKSQISSENVNMPKSNAGVDSYNNNEINTNVNISTRQEKTNIIKRNEENDILCQTFDESEFEIIFCPVHGKQYVKKKKFKKFN